MNCPKCKGVLDLEEDELDEGDEFSCDECGAELVVTGKDPLDIELVAEADEDDEDEEEDFEEDEDDEDEENEDEDEAWR